MVAAHLSEGCAGVESGRIWVCLKACQHKRGGIASHGSKMEGQTRHHHQPSVHHCHLVLFPISMMFCLAGKKVQNIESTGDVSGRRSKACLVMGSFSRKGKAGVLQRIGRFNNIVSIRKEGNC